MLSDIPTHFNFHYLKTKRGAKTPDFLVELPDESIVVEIGGKGKGREQFPTHSPEVRSNKKPLSLLGFTV
jgi:hypothetical protein